MSKDKNGPVVAKRAVASVAKTGRGGRFTSTCRERETIVYRSEEALKALARMSNWLNIFERLSARVLSTGRDTVRSGQSCDSRVFAHPRNVHAG